jgi:nucleoid-associated protein YgaU
MQTLTVRGGTLFDIASRYLGDATQWDTIANLNGIDDPWLSGIVTLVIPDSSAGGTGVGQ